MNNPPLIPLHENDALIPLKLETLARISTVKLIESLAPGNPGALKTRPDGTILDGHHRIKVLRDRGVNVDMLPREVIPRSNEQ